MIRTLTLVVGMLWPVALTVAQGIEGKSGLPNLAAGHPLALTERHGPFLVKVMTFGGEEASQNANTLAKELREKHGIDAYVYAWRYELPRPDPRILQAYEDRYGIKPRLPKLNSAPPENWVVFAGNFPTDDSREAKRFLNKIKKIKTTSLRPELYTIYIGQADRTTAQQREPFAKAMFARNPMLPPVERPVIDPETAKLYRKWNDAEKYSVYNNTSPFTLTVAVFRGNVAYREDQEKNKGVEKSGLMIAAQNACNITEQLRRQGHEAYVWHGEYASLVCYGGYQSPDDPKLQQDIQKIAQIKVNGVLKFEPKLIITPQRPPILGN